MTTARSPLRILTGQAKTVAKMLKACERGEKLPGDYGAKIEAARGRPSIQFAVIMDDKVLKIRMSWATIRETTELAISEYILRQMREARDALQ
jgi:hypothetical protein